MAKRRSSNILITEIYEANKRKINVHDEARGNTLSAELPYPCSTEQAQAMKEDLIERVKEMAHAKSDRHSEAGMPSAAPALSNTPVAA